MTLAKMLGVSLQSLANWRVRGTGPKFEPRFKGKGNKIFYRLDNVLEWLSRQHGEHKPAWEFSRDWLEARGISVENSTVESTEWLIACVDQYFEIDLND